ncbi:MAG: DUF3108 domain-containing protein [gamma proteobacterium symbiont of Lucinoma myriamae]|nr:DUF3108 domain-containing protein [gamma proteobacterium symbiont of Lucinoma myriamae]MCU7819046.1 DUF3108 domain-containing protein [gamma proteobacterium symbiont of Lucinoma myriamae]MCU7831346.1 DUF3108 domain-containing protein [gamma proteobacterium symbiont of Lucinoma myriamae]
MKLQRSCLIIFLVSFFSFNHVTADTKIQLKPFVATYMITAMGLEGINVTNSLSLNQSNGEHQQYHFKSYSMPIGLLAFKKDETRDEQSEGSIIDGQIQPEHYTYLQLRNDKKRRDVELTFDWLRKEVSNNHKHKNSKWHLSIPEHTIDKLSYQLALMLKLANDPDKHFSFYVADGGKLKEYNFEVLREERVYTSLGSYKAIKIQHQRYKKGKNITLWCAPDLNYLPVKIIQEETGKPTFISTLISYQEGMSNH